MRLTITRVSTKDVDTKFGARQKVGIQAKELGEGVWANALMPECNINIGNTIEAQVYDDPKWGKQFKLIMICDEAPVAGNDFSEQPEPTNEDKKWEDIRKNKRDDISWMNAKNNAVQIVVGKGIPDQELEKQTIVDYANWIYELEFEKQPEYVTAPF
jgi:hypothetical protein